MDVAQACYENDWRRRSIAQRAGIVHAAAIRMRQQSDDLAGLVTLEMGKPIAEAKSEVTLSADIFDYYAERAEAFLKPRPIPDVPNATIETFPLGSILGVEPWKLPLLPTRPRSRAQLMVGNVLVVKHAPNVPQSALASRGSRRGGRSEGRLHQHLREHRSGRPADRGSARSGRDGHRQRTRRRRCCRTRRAQAPRSRSWNSAAAIRSSFLRTLHLSLR